MDFEVANLSGSGRDSKSNDSSSKSNVNTSPVSNGWRFCASIFGLSGGQFLSFLSIFLGSSFFTGECEKKGINGISLGFITGMVQGSVAFTTCIFLGLVHTTSLKHFVIIGQTFCGAALIAFGFTDLIQSANVFLVTCLVIRFLHGTTMSLSNLSALIAISRISPEEKLATVMGVNEFCVALGLALSPLFGGILFDLGTYKTPFLVCGGMFGLFIIFSVFLIPKDVVVSKRPIQEMLRDTGQIKLHCFILFTIGGFIGFFSGMIEPHLRQYNLSASLTGSIIFVTNGISALAFPILGRICDKSGNPALVMIASFSIGILGLVLFGPLPGMPIPSELWIVIISLILCGISISGSSIGCYAQTRKKLGECCKNDEQADMVTCSVYAVWTNLGSFASSVLGGVFIEYIGYRKGSAILLGIQILAITMELVLLWKSKSHLKLKEKPPENIPVAVSCIYKN